MPWKEPVIESERQERLAVNLADLDRVDPMIRSMLLGGKLGLVPIRIDPDRIDETAVAFRCDLLTAASCLDVLRQHDKRAGDYPTRAYIKRRSSWTKLASSTVLTYTVGDQIKLREDVFMSEVELATPEPVRPRRVL